MVVAVNIRIKMRLKVKRTNRVINAINTTLDIHPKERQSIADALSRKLKHDGILYIKEQIRESHGMPVDEIQNLFSSVNLKEIKFSTTDKEYSGKFQVNPK